MQGKNLTSTAETGKHLEVQSPKTAEDMILQSCC